MKQESIYRVLVVDDERSALLVASAILSEEFEVVSCETAQDALLQLQQGTFHVVCTDFQMPGMNGLTLLRQAFQAAEHLYGIIVTGHAEAFQRERGEDDRRLGFLFKPYDPERLLQLTKQFAHFAEMKRKVSRLSQKKPE